MTPINATGTARAELLPTNVKAKEEHPVTEQDLTEATARADELTETVNGLSQTVLDQNTTIRAQSDVIKDSTREIKKEIKKVEEQNLLLKIAIVFAAGILIAITADTFPEQTKRLTNVVCRLVFGDPPLTNSTSTNSPLSNATLLDLP